ncbi:MAG: hypothetical protein CL920_00115 [Deltaproteobacteria bacterium]|nr:hypothetical protein [Deltaproteobacteria bacterium]
MNQCPHCEGFITVEMKECPHCDTSLPSSSPFMQRIKRFGLGRSIVAAAGGSAFMLTLMACYGAAPPCDMVDNDKDGYTTCSDGTNYAGGDCKDDDATINPGAEDKAGDDIDQNCDGVDGVAQ